MKKKILIAFFAIATSFNISAENLKLKIEGPENSYNHLRIINNTQFKNFDCQVYGLKKKSDKYIITETIGSFCLKGYGDTDTCSVSISKNTYIGISLPDEIENPSYAISYIDLPFFDTVEIKIIESSLSKKSGKNSIGKEFN